MDRDQKAAQVEEMTAKLGDAEAIFAVDYRGISVPQAAELRARLAEADATFRIVKNRLAKLAADNAGTDGLVELLEGPTALTFVKGDPVTAAKALATFGREHKLLEFKGGLMEGAALAPEQFQAIARLPGLDVLHGQLVGVAASPITGLARGLGAMLSGLAIGLGQIQEKGLVAGDAEPQPEAPAEEPAAEEEAEEPKAEKEAEEPKAEAEPEDQGEGEPEAEGPPQSDETEDESSSEESEPQADDSEDTEKEE
jgi:large subunit ribosomal protein L10